MTRLEGKVAVITGAGRQPGLGIALCFARAGARVFLLEQHPGAGEQALAQVRAISADAVLKPVGAAHKPTLQATLQAIAAACGHLDILVNAAQAHSPWLPLEEKTDAMFAETLTVGFYGALWAMQAVLPAMRAGGGGRIINIGSVYGDNAPEYIGDYCAAVRALEGLTRTAAMEWGRHNILVNLLVPTLDDAGFRDYCAHHPEAVAEPLQLVPLRRFGDPERDIGGAALFLAGDNARYITGQVIHADGGYHLNAPVLVPRPGERFSG